MINDGVQSGTVGLMGGTPGNALSPGWQRCYEKALNPSIKTLGPADTYWANDIALQDGQRLALDQPRHRGVRL